MGSATFTYLATRLTAAPCWLGHSWIRSDSPKSEYLFKMGLNMLDASELGSDHWAEPIGLSLTCFGTLLIQQILDQI